MKIRCCSLMIIVVVTLAALTMPAFSETANRGDSFQSSRATGAFFILPTNNTAEWCTVVLDNPRSSLNVRDANGRVINKLRHGASVYVDAYDGGFARVSVKRRGRLITLGWVASEYLSC